MTTTKNIRTRDDLRVDTIYLNEITGTAFVTPDGIGLIHFDTLADAMVEYWGVASEVCHALSAADYEAVANS